MSLIQTPNCAWNLTDLKSVPKNGIKVFSTFACGGGSTMGYKRAGCDVVGANDIDPEMAWHYKVNHSPRHYLLCPIRDLLTADLPQELFGIDILDGSPPCSTFSTSGNREDDWGREKHFREGQAKQILSDLFFDFLNLAERLQPRTIIAENVKGMIIGNAKGYCKMVMQRLRDLGYRPQLFLINAADCGVPQRRERVFFCAVRNDVSDRPLKLTPKHQWISVGEATRDLQGTAQTRSSDVKLSDLVQTLWNGTKPGDSLDKASLKINGKPGWFTWNRLAENQLSPTVVAGADSTLHWSEPRRCSFAELKRIGSFPDDYVARTNAIGKYMVGMSVPPKMMEVVARAVCSQWLGVCYVAS